LAAESGVEHALQVALWIGCLALIWYLLQPRYQFVVRIRDGQARVTRGKVTEAFLEDIRDACRDVQLRAGWVGGIRRGKRIVLAFNRRMPLPLRQRLRNAWMIHH
jgi:hypothetical protein